MICNKLDDKTKKARAKRLNDIIQRKKENNEKISCRVLGSKLNMNHSAISQYITGKIPLGITAIIKFANVLDCSVKEIEPDFFNILGCKSDCIQ